MPCGTADQRLVDRVHLGRKPPADRQRSADNTGNCADVSAEGERAEPGADNCAPRRQEGIRPESGRGRVGVGKGSGRSQVRFRPGFIGRVQAGFRSGRLMWIVCLNRAKEE